MFRVTGALEMGAAQLDSPTLYGGGYVWIRVEIGLLVKVLRRKDFSQLQRCGPKGTAPFSWPRCPANRRVKTLIMPVMIGEELPQLWTVEYLSIDMGLGDILSDFVDAFRKPREAECPIELGQITFARHAGISCQPPRDLILRNLGVVNAEYESRLHIEKKISMPKKKIHDGGRISKICRHNLGIELLPLSTYLIKIAAADISFKTEVQVGNKLRHRFADSCEVFDGPTEPDQAVRHDVALEVAGNPVGMASKIEE